MQYILFVGRCVLCLLAIMMTSADCEVVSVCEWLTYDCETLLIFKCNLSLGPLRRSTEWPDGAVRKKAHRKRCARKQKRGKRAGICARLKANPNRPTIPSILFANVHSLENNLDHLWLQGYRKNR